MIPAESMSKIKVVGYKNIDLEPYDGPPYSYSVIINDKKKTMSGFNEQHIQDQLYPKKADKIIKLKDK